MPQQPQLCANIGGTSRAEQQGRAGVRRQHGEAVQPCAEQEGHAHEGLSAGGLAQDA